MDLLPEPLATFDIATSSLSTQLLELDDLKNRLQSERSAGRIAAPTVDALRVEATYHSNALEGNTLSLRDTQLVLEGQAPAGKSLREIYEARNHDRALRLIEQWTADRPVTKPLDVQDLLDVHARLMTDIDENAGRFRSHRVLITGTSFVPPGPQKFTNLLPEMIALANRPGLHPVLRGAELHYNIAAVHPFADGNGRTARLFMNYLLMRGGFPLTFIEVSHRSAYLNALDAANAGDVRPFADLMAQCVASSLSRWLGNE